MTKERARLSSWGWPSSDGQFGTMWDRTERPVGWGGLYRSWFSGWSQATPKINSFLKITWYRWVSTWSAGKPDPGGGEAEQRITIVLREAAEGEKPLGCISWKRIGASVWPSPPSQPWP